MKVLSKFLRTLISYRKARRRALAAVYTFSIFWTLFFSTGFSTSHQILPAAEIKKENVFKSATEHNKDDESSPAPETKDHLQSTKYRLPETATLDHGYSGYGYDLSYRLRVKQKRLWFFTARKNDLYTLYIDGKPAASFRGKGSNPFVLYNNEYALCSGNRLKTESFEKKLPHLCKGLGRLPGSGDFIYLYRTYDKEKKYPASWKVFIGDREQPTSPIRFDSRELKVSPLSDHYLVISYHSSRYNNNGYYHLETGGKTLGHFIHKPADIVFDETGFSYTICEPMAWSRGNQRCTRYHYTFGNEAPVPVAEAIQTDYTSGLYTFIVHGSLLGEFKLCPVHYQKKLPPPFLMNTQKQTAVLECDMEGYKLTLGQSVYGPYPHIFKYAIAPGSRGLAVLYSRSKEPEPSFDSPKELIFQGKIYHNILDFTFTKEALYFAGYKDKVVTHYRLAL